MQTPEQIISPQEALKRAATAAINANYIEADTFSLLATAITEVLRWEDALLSHRVALAAKTFVRNPSKTAFDAMQQALHEWEDQIRSENA